VSTPKLSGRWRLVIALVVFAMVAVACGDDDAGDTTTTAAGGTTTTAGATTTTEAPPAVEFTYRTGIFQDTTTDNYWAYIDPASTVWNAYLLGATKPALFANNAPGFELSNDTAASPDPGVATDNGDGTFSVTVAMRDDANWSDGTPITAGDVVFTAETVRDAVLGGGWVDSYRWALTAEDGTVSNGLTAVEAIDDKTVKFTWNFEPGLAVWPYGPGVGPIMAEHFWGPVVEEALASADPAETIYAASGAGDVSGGPMIFDSREAGAFARTVANVDYFDKGREITSGGVTYTVGPFISDQIYSLYADQSAAVLALKAGEVDFLYNPLGLQRGLQDQITSDPNLTAVVNATNGFRYMAFNLRKEPMSNEGFRDALAFMINKEYVATSVLQGVAFPLYATVPEGNSAWYDEAIADEFAAEITGLELTTRHDGIPFADPGEDGVVGTADDGEAYTATGNEARLHAAVATLKANGFTWPEGQEPDFRDNAIVPGEGIMLNGETVQHMEILAPGPGYDPLRATYSLIIAQALSDLGFDVDAFPTDFNVLVNTVYVPNDAGELTFDMFLLGWSLGNPAFPTYHESFFAGKNDTLVNDGNNAPGFNDPDFNALVEEFNQAQTQEEAKAIMWEMERILFDKKPYILLFDTGILEAYRSASVSFPFTETLSGIQLGNGFSGLVAAAS
jgi:ABC-type transport system substrate-binding protein